MAAKAQFNPLIILTIPVAAVLIAGALWLVRYWTPYVSMIAILPSGPHTPIPPDERWAELRGLIATLNVIKPDLLCVQMTSSQYGSSLEGLFPTEVALARIWARQHSAQVLNVDSRPNVRDWQLRDIHDWGAWLESLDLPTLVAGDTLRLPPKDREQIESSPAWNSRLQTIVTQCLDPAYRQHFRHVAFVFSAWHTPLLRKAVKQFFSLDLHPVFAAATKLTSPSPQDQTALAEFKSKLMTFRGQLNDVLKTDATPPGVKTLIEQSPQRAVLDDLLNH